MSSVADLLFNLQTIGLTEESYSYSPSVLDGTVAGSSAYSKKDCPLANLPYDIFTHDLVPQFASPVLVLESSSASVQVTPSVAPLKKLASTSKYFQWLVHGQYKTYLQHQYPRLYAKVVQQSFIDGGDGDLSAIGTDWAAKVAEAEELTRRWSQRRLCISPVSLPEDSLGEGQSSNWRQASHQRPWNRRRTGPDYSPCLDLYETASGSEILAVGQGKRLAIRKGEDASWRTFTKEGSISGSDDILKVHIYDEDTVIATRSTGVDVVTNIVKDDEELEVSSTFNFDPVDCSKPSTDGISSSCLDGTSSTGQRLFAITTTQADDHNLQIFNIDAEDGSISISSSHQYESSIPSKPWVSTFLNPTTITVGHRAGIALYNLSAGALSSPINLPQPSTSYPHDLGVHSITALSAPFSPSIFASGWSDGLSRLFDIRSNKYVGTYADTISAEPVPVYSLLHTSPLGNNLIAGSSRHHALQIHDLRYPATTSTGTWESLNGTGLSNGPLSAIDIGSGSASKIDDVLSDGCLIFIGNIAAYNQRDPEVQVRNRNQRQGSTAIYSLCGTTNGGKIYLGAENRVLKLDFRDLSTGTREGTKIPVEETQYFAPMYWFDPNKGVQWDDNVESCWNGNRWFCGKGKKPWKGLLDTI